MSERKQKKMGRPTIESGYTAQLPRIRVSPLKLNEYKQKAKDSKKSLSHWVRDTLDKEIDR